MVSLNVVISDNINSFLITYEIYDVLFKSHIRLFNISRDEYYTEDVLSACKIG